ncbi:MAG: FkbM family methyltransferase [Segetibacter sp.]
MYFKKIFTKNSVIVDCGAHVGADSVELSKIFPKGQVHSFEPIPSIFKRLHNNSKKRSNIYCYELALSNRNGVAEMFVSSGSSDASSSLLAPTGHLKDHPDVYFENSIEVKTQTLDTWAAKNNIEKVDFLWLDMQGFELPMLQASNKILSTVKAIHTEVSTRETYSNSVLYNDFRKWLESIGFKVIAEAIPAGTDMGNALFLRR